jgi:ribosome assembly protein YihI (activator of Der GTPase)
VESIKELYDRSEAQKQIIQDQQEMLQAQQEVIQKLIDRLGL